MAINDPKGVPYLSADEMHALREESSLAAVLPWGRTYPPNPGVAPIQRVGHHAFDVEGRKLADAHQRILSYSLGGHRSEIHEAIVAAQCRYPDMTMVDTTELFEPAELLKHELHEAMFPYGDYLAQLATTGTGANNQAIRLAMGSLGGQDNVQLVVLEGNYGGADAQMNDLCDAPGWKGATSFFSDKKVLKLDASNIDEIFASLGGKKPILLMEDGVQGVGGFNVLDIDFLRAITERTHEAGGRTISDNVQTFVRATEGKGLFGFNRWADPDNPKHTPDFVTLAKGLGDGHPQGAVMTLREVAEQVKDPGNTFDTNNQYRNALAVARTVIAVSQRENLAQSVHDIGVEFRRQLETAIGPFLGLVKGVVGIGGMTGLEFRKGDKLVEAMVVAPESGLLVAKGGGPDNWVMRLPLQFDATNDFGAEVAQCVEDMLKKVAV